MGKWLVISGPWLEEEQPLRAQCTGHQPITNRQSPITESSRRGISLMEVLISMFVLAVGLMGVAALIPAGRHEIVEGTKLENASMVGRSAFRDLQIRGFLKPANWRQTAGSTVPLFNATAADKKHFTGWLSGGGSGSTYQAAFCIDPLGRTASPTNYSPKFPEGATGDPVPLLRVLPFPPATTNAQDIRATFDTIFRGSFDLITEPNTTNRDLPPTQRFFKDASMNPVRRASDGNYSWLATVVSDPTNAIGAVTNPSTSPLDVDVTVSVAVFYKRILSSAGAGEYIADLAAFPVLPMTSGGEAILSNLPNDATNQMVSVKPGQWIMLAGYTTVNNPLPPPPATINKYYYHWYRVLSAAQPDTAARTQRVTLAGRDWTITNTNAKAWLFDNVISVYEKNLRLEY